MLLIDKLFDCCRDFGLLLVRLHLFDHVVDRVVSELILLDLEVVRVFKSSGNAVLKLARLELSFLLQGLLLPFLSRFKLPLKGIVLVFDLSVQLSLDFVVEVSNLLKKAISLTFIDARLVKLVLDVLSLTDLLGEWII